MDFPTVPPENHEIYPKLPVWADINFHAVKKNLWRIAKHLDIAGRSKEFLVAQ